MIFLIPVKVKLLKLLFLFLSSPREKNSFSVFLTKKIQVWSDAALSNLWIPKVGCEVGLSSMESDLFEENVEVDHLVCNTLPQVQDTHISPQNYTSKYWLDKA